LAGAPAVAVAGLTKAFGDRVAYQDVTFEVGQGEVFGFLGPNGAGKTTTVRTLGTLVSPTAGQAEVVGLALLPANALEIRRRIAIMPESPGLYLKLSVAENLRCFADLYEVDDPAGRIRSALAAVHLEDRTDDACGSLSKGLRQRVALARALLCRPQVLFLDEPTSGLDPVAARDVHDLIDGLRRDGVTVFLTTHRLGEAERLCDRVAILNTTLRTIGTPAELRERIFARSLEVRVGGDGSAAARVLAAIPGVDRCQAGEPGRFILSVADPDAVAPAVVRGLVAAGMDVFAVGEAQHSLEDVYMKFVEQ
jgi:ABC-2 type transport system ATP-binding protein